MPAPPAVHPGALVPEPARSVSSGRGTPPRRRRGSRRARRRLVVLRSFGPGYRVGRLLAGDADRDDRGGRGLAAAGTPRYVRVDGRIDSAGRLPRRARAPARLPAPAARGAPATAAGRSSRRTSRSSRSRSARAWPRGDRRRRAGATGLVVLPRESVGDRRRRARPGARRTSARDAGPAPHRAGLRGRARHGPRRPGASRRRIDASSPPGSAGRSSCPPSSRPRRCSCWPAVGAAGRCGDGAARGRARPPRRSGWPGRSSRTVGAVVVPASPSWPRRPSPQPGAGWRHPERRRGSRASSARRSPRRGLSS